MRVHFSQLFFYGKFWKVSRLYHRLRAFRGHQSLKSQILMILCVAKYHRFGHFEVAETSNLRFWWYYVSRCIITSGTFVATTAQIPDSDDTTRRDVSSLGTFRGCRDLKSQILMILRVARYHHSGSFQGHNGLKPQILIILRVVWRGISGPLSLKPQAFSGQERFWLFPFQIEFDKIPLQLCTPQRSAGKRYNSEREWRICRNKQCGRFG